MVMASFKKTYTNTLAPRTVIVSAPDSTADHCQHMPRPETPGKSQSSLAQSLVRSLLLFPGSLCTHKVLFVPSKSLFPQSCGSSIIKSHWASKSNSLQVLRPFARSPGWESVVGPRTFATVQELLWYNHSPVCGSSAPLLCSGANGNLL